MTDGTLAAVDGLGDVGAEVLDRWEQSAPPDTVAQVQSLLQVYAAVTDRGLSDRFTSLFTPDAEWDGTALGYGSARGPDAIAALVLGHYDPLRPMAHLCGPPVVTSRDGTADEVASLCWCWARRLGDGPHPLIVFSYADVCRRAGPGAPWRFARRALLPAGPANAEGRTAP